MRLKGDGWRDHAGSLGVLQRGVKPQRTLGSLGLAVAYPDRLPLRQGSYDDFVGKEKTRRIETAGSRCYVGC